MMTRHLAQTFVALGLLATLAAVCCVPQKPINWGGVAQCAGPAGPDLVAVLRSPAWPTEEVDDDVANFVYPSWFERDGQAPYDHAGRLAAPGQVGPNGYVILRSADDPSNQWLEGPTGAFPNLTHAQLQKLVHPLGRTHRRLGLSTGGAVRGPSK